jgi:hypothetical protein
MDDPQIAKTISTSRRLVVAVIYPAPWCESYEPRALYRLSADLTAIIVDRLEVRAKVRGVLRFIDRLSLRGHRAD